jgi:recombination protein RecR
MKENNLEKLIYLFSRIPGFGPRSARRAVLHLIKYRESLMVPLADMMKFVAEITQNCKKCGNFDTASICNICTDPKREKSIICVVETIADLWAIERGKMYIGLYHVLGGTLSATQNKSPEALNIPKLIERIENEEVEEVIIATNATVDGQTTAYYLTEKLKNFEIKISRLAHGIPLGGELDYLDEGTLSAALSSRQPF